MPLLIHVNQGGAPVPPSPIEHTTYIFSEDSDGYISNSDSNFATCQSDATGDLVVTGATTNSVTFGANWNSPNFTIWRGFFEFDFSVLSAATRTITSTTMNMAGVSSSDSSVVALVGTQAASLTTADYDAFTGSPITSPTAWEHIGNVYNEMVFNAAGITYIDGHFTAGTTAKLCGREYEHDYLNTTVGTGSFRNGCVMADYGDNLSPYIKVVYDKTPEYTANVALEANWTIFTGSWNGSGFDSSGSALTLSSYPRTWVNQQREWAGIKITFTGASNLDLSVDSDANYVIVDDVSITSGQTIPMKWWGRWDESKADLDEIRLTSSGASFTVTAIEFLEA